jgi:GNAT superfamily N-acetyltransferase
LNKIAIRRGKRRDWRDFIGLLVDLANFEHLKPPDKQAKRRIVQDVFSKKIVYLFLAYWGKEPVGYALYFYTYSSFLARPTFYLEDIFVLEKYRHKGIGKELFLRCVEEAGRMGCGRFEFSVLTWNKNAINFYENLGAKRLDQWYYYRIDSYTITKLRRTVRTQTRTSRRA